MNGDTLERIRQASPAIRDRWEELLRAAPPTTPVSNPDAMVARIPDSIAQIIRALRWATVGRASRRSPRPLRRCAHNPFRTYFLTGEQALLEAIALTPDAPELSPTCSASNPLAASHSCDQSDRGAAPGAENGNSPTVPEAAASVSRAVETLATADVDAFCCVCRKYRLVAVCRCGR